MHKFCIVVVTRPVPYPKVIMTCTGFFMELKYITNTNTKGDTRFILLERKRDDDDDDDDDVICVQYNTFVSVGLMKCRSKTSHNARRMPTCVHL
jgi:hypothetical protein